MSARFSVEEINLSVSGTDTTGLISSDQMTAPLIDVCVAGGLHHLPGGVAANLTHWGRDKMATISQSPVDSPHKGLAMRKMFPFDDVIMVSKYTGLEVLPGLSKLNKATGMTRQGWEFPALT